jgi:hypothetical protein
MSLLLATQHDRLNLPEQMSLWLLLALGAKFTLAFLWRQHRALHPLLPLSLFAHPAYAAVSFIGMVSGVALYATVVFLPQYLQVGLHLSPTRSAWHLLPLMAGITVAAVSSGKLLRAQTPVVSLARTASILMLLSCGLVAGVLRWVPQMPSVLSACLLPLGLGLGLLLPLITVVAQSVSPRQHMGIATAAPVMLRSLGGAAGVALLAALLTRLVKQEVAAIGTEMPSETLTTALAHGLQPVFACVAGVVLLAFLACAWLRPARVFPLAQQRGADPTGQSLKM